MRWFAPWIALHGAFTLSCREDSKVGTRAPRETVQAAPSASVRAPDHSRELEAIRVESEQATARLCSAAKAWKAWRPGFTRKQFLVPPSAAELPAPPAWGPCPAHVDLPRGCRSLRATVGGWERDTTLLTAPGAAGGSALLSFSLACDEFRLLLVMNADGPLRAAWADPTGEELVHAALSNDRWLGYVRSDPPRLSPQGAPIFHVIGRKLDETRTEHLGAVAEDSNFSVFQIEGSRWAHGSETVRVGRWGEPPRLVRGAVASTVAAFHLHDELVFHQGPTARFLSVSRGLGGSRELHGFEGRQPKIEAIATSDQFLVVEANTLDDHGIWVSPYADDADSVRLRKVAKGVGLSKIVDGRVAFKAVGKAVVLDLASSQLRSFAIPGCPTAGTLPRLCLVEGISLGRDEMFVTAVIDSRYTLLRIPLSSLPLVTPETLAR